MSTNTLKFSQMPLATSLPEEAIVPIVSGGTNQRITIAALRGVLSPADWSGTQTEYNALQSRDANRNYIVTLDDATVAVYRGDTLLWAEPNVIGEFAGDSTPEDWHWYPNTNKEKVSLPVDPATLRFSFYWPEPLKHSQGLFVPTIADTAKLKRLEKIPALGASSTGYYIFAGLKECEVLPVLDLRNRSNTFLSYPTLYGTPAGAKCKRFAFANTQGINEMSGVLNIQNADGTVVALTGLDMTSCLNNATIEAAFNNLGPSYIQIVNLGKAAGLQSVHIGSKRWGDDTVLSHSRKSLVDTLITNSFDRVASGYDVCVIKMHADAIARLTPEEKAAIAAKGYTLVAT